MKNNPFLPWGTTEILMDRKEEARILSHFVSEVSAGKAGIMMCRGAPGSGKTALLRLAEKEARGAKLLTGFVKAGKKEKETGLVRALKAEFEDEISKLSHSEDVVFAKARQFSQEGAGTFNQLFSAAARAVGNKPIFIIIDDFDLVQKPQDILRAIANDIERRAVGVLISAAGGFALPPEAVLLELKAVGEEDFRIYAEELTKKGVKMGDECLKAVYADSGGNPKTIQLVLWHLYDAAKETDKVISRAHYTANFRGVLALLAHEWFSRQYFEASDEEKRILRRLAHVGETSVTELAKSIGKKPGPVATLLLRLEAHGDVIKVARGKYKVFCPLYAKFILERS